MKGLGCCLSVFVCLFFLTLFERISFFKLIFHYSGGCWKEFVFYSFFCFFLGLFERVWVLFEFFYYYFFPGVV